MGERRKEFLEGPRGSSSTGGASRTRSTVHAISSPSSPPQKSTSEESSQDQPPTTTALLTASGEGDHQRVKYLLEVLKVDVNELSPDGETALHAAAIRGDPDTTRLLLEHGAVVDARSPSGTQRSMTPLQWACYGGHEGMISLLLKAGADPWLKDETGMTAFDMAIESGHDNVLHLLEGSWREEKREEL